MTGIAAVIYRDWRQRITNIGFVFWDLFVPIAYLTLFGTGFERALARSFWSTVRRSNTPTICCRG